MWLRQAVGVVRTIALALVLSISASGCLWLAIPGLAYQGYEYEKKQSAKPSHTERGHAHPTPSPELE